MHEPSGKYKLIAGEKVSVPGLPGAWVMSDKHKALHNMFVVQMNDLGCWRGYIYLRQMYDLLLLSEKMI